jgi:hypothetical protein
MGDISNIDHAERAHSRVGPSQAEPLFHCLGSVKMVEQHGIEPASPGRAALAGTRAHQMAETALLKRSPVVGEDDMAEAARGFVALVEGEVGRSGPDHILLVEARVDMSRHHPELYGSVDAMLYDPGRSRLWVYDLKTGVAPVEADALQLQLYAAMGLESLGARAENVATIETVVYQPFARHPDGITRRARHSRANIRKVASAYVEKVYLALDSNEPQPLTAGKWCRWCRARAVCPAYRAMQTEGARIEFAPDGSMSQTPTAADAIPVEQLGAMLTACARLKPWIAAVEARALFLMQHLDADLNGWTLRDKRPVRSWIDEERALKRLRSMGLPTETLFEQKFVSPAQAERLLRPADRATVADLIIATSSGKTLAPLPTNTASADFNEEQGTSAP